MAPHKRDYATDTTEAHPMTSTVRGPSAASASKFKNLHAWRNVVESCCTVCSLKTMFHYGCCSPSYWNLSLHTFHIINSCATNVLGPGGSAHLPFEHYWHVVSPGTTIRDAFFDPDFPDFFALLAPSARMWQQLLVVSQAEGNDLGKAVP